MVGHAQNHLNRVPKKQAATGNVTYTLENEMTLVTPADGDKVVGLNSSLGIYVDAKTGFLRHDGFASQPQAGSSIPCTTRLTRGRTKWS